MNTTFFGSIDYLMEGTPDQQSVYRVLQESNIMNILKAFDAVLAGTYPLGINVTGSDLDIICYVANRDDFLKTIKKNFGKNDNFKISESDADEAIIINFSYNGMDFEIYGQNKPVKKQNAYIHMVNEYKLLNIHGKDFRKKIIELKRKGMKTEPAFACLLNLDGDPYSAMLKIEI